MLSKSSKLINKCRHQNKYLTKRLKEKENINWKYSYHRRSLFWEGFNVAFILGR